jgi:hypothetical protein
VTSPIFTGGDSDAGGRDPVSGSVDGSVASAVARYAELQADTFGAGSTIGDLMDLPSVPANTLPPASEPGQYGNAGDEPIVG